MKHLAIFERFEIELTEEEARLGAHPGPCDDDIASLLLKDSIREQFESISDDDIRKELKEFGAWDSDELDYIGVNRARILWIACGNVLEDMRTRVAGEVD